MLKQWSWKEFISEGGIFHSVITCNRFEQLKPITTARLVNQHTQRIRSRFIDVYRQVKEVGICWEGTRIC